MNFQQLLNNHIEAYNALLALYSTATQRRILLMRVGFPTHHIPIDSLDTESFFLTVLSQIDYGILPDPGGLERLLQVAAEMYPGNRAFDHWRLPTAGKSAPRDRRGVEERLDVDTILHNSDHNTVDQPEAVSELTNLFHDFDIFICYSRQSVEHVMQVRKELVRRSLKPWMDLLHIQPGQSYQSAIEDVLRQVPVIVVCIGSEGLERWQRVEAEVAMDRHVDGKCTVIPVTLPGASTGMAAFPLFLKTLHSIPLNGEADNDAYYQLVDRIKAAKARKREHK